MDDARCDQIQIHFYNNNKGFDGWKTYCEQHPFAGATGTIATAEALYTAYYTRVTLYPFDKLI